MLTTWSGIKAYFTTAAISTLVANWKGELLTKIYLSYRQVISLSIIRMFCGSVVFKYEIDYGNIDVWGIVAFF